MTLSLDQKFRNWLAEAWPDDEFVYCEEQKPLVDRAATAGMVARGWRAVGDVHFCVRLNYRVGESFNDH